MNEISYRCDGGIAGPWGIMDSSYNNDEYHMYTEDMIISVYDNNMIRVTKDKNGKTGDINLKQLINLTSELIVKKCSTDIEFFDDSIKKEIKESIMEILKNNKLI